MRLLRTAQSLSRLSLSYSQRSSSSAAQTASSSSSTRPSSLGMVWPAGTWDDPLPISSSEESRMVSCTGHSLTPHSHSHAHSVTNHEPVWMEVRRGELCQCPQCRQVFMLKSRANS